MRPQLATSAAAAAVAVLLGSTSVDAFLHLPARGTLIESRARSAAATTRSPTTATGTALRAATAADITTSGKLEDGGQTVERGQSVLYLATDAGADKALEPGGFATLREKVGQGPKLMHVPVDVKNGLSFQLADELMAALDGLPAPVLAVCASGARASAVKCLRKALAEGFGRDEALAYAQAEKMSFLKNAYLTDWVLGTVAHKQFEGKASLLFRPLFEPESSTYTYILADPETKEAIIIDPVDLTVDRDIQVAEEMGVKLVYAVNTHCHADHVTGSGLLMRKLPGCKSAIAEASGAQAAVKLKDGERIHFGGRYLECRATPGHTDGCMSFLSDDYSMVFTGDALLIRGCGRTDFQQGSPDKLFDSINTKIFTLPGETLVYPGHDYRGRLFTTIAEDKKYNLRIGQGRTKEQFTEIMNNLKLDYPKKIDISLPSNKVDGLLGH